MLVQSQNGRSQARALLLQTPEGSIEMSDMNLDPKLESLRAKTMEFVNHERESVTDFSNRFLTEVEAAMIQSIESASTRLESMLTKVGNVVTKEPLVALAALAISGIAVFSLISKKTKTPAKAPEPLKH
jgi:hypothetical protein